MTSDQEEQKKKEQAFAVMGQQVVSNEAYRAAITSVKGEIFKVFCDTKQEQQDVRDEAWRTMNNINNLERFLNDFLTTGKMNDLMEEMQK